MESFLIKIRLSQILLAFWRAPYYLTRVNEFLMTQKTRLAGVKKAILTFLVHPVPKIQNVSKYQGVKEFHMLARICCYCKIMVFSPFELGDTYSQSSKGNK